jgi:hypothetical protein
MSDRTNYDNPRKYPPEVDGPEPTDDDTLAAFLNWLGLDDDTDAFEDNLADLLRWVIDAHPEKVPQSVWDDAADRAAQREIAAYEDYQRSRWGFE